MIAASEPQEFVPSGRQQARRHPGPIDGTDGHEEANDKYLIQDFEKVSIVDGRTAERWSLRLTPGYFEEPTAGNVKGTGRTEPGGNGSFTCKEQPRKRPSDIPPKSRFSGGGDAKPSQNGDGADRRSLPIARKPLLEFMEEELYFGGNTVVWSRGTAYAGQRPTREVICCYTTLLPVRCALWCDFYCERPVLRGVPEAGDGPPAAPVPCVAVVDAQTLRVYAKDSEGFVVALAFPVGRVWTTRFGVLLERDAAADGQRNRTQPAEKPPTMYSLSHPLDEFSPVSARHGGGAAQIVDDPLLQVVFTSDAPSVCMVFDGHTRQHHVYKIRRLPGNEWVDVFNKSGGDTPSIFSLSGKAKSSHSIWDNYRSTAAPSPFSTKSNSVSSVQSHFQSRSQSPMIHNNSSASLGSASPWNLKSSRLNSLLRNADAPRGGLAENDLETSQSVSAATPKLCLEHLWADSVTSNVDALHGPATKAFITEDFTSQSYLCYLIPTKNQLYVVKIEISDDNVAFGMSTSIGAKDAVSVPTTHMYAILEHSGNVVLYSGLSVIGKLNIAGVLPQHMPSPYVMQNIRHLQSPFPRRSSLLPTCDSSTPAPRFDEHLLSPVLPSVGGKPKTVHISSIFTSDNRPQLVGLRDPVLNRITLQYSDGTYYRIKLPYVAASTLVESCVNVLRECLPRDILMTVIVRWYTTRNSLGNTDLTSEKEWEMFSSVIFQLLGYEEGNASDASSDQSSTPSSEAKRLRHSYAADKTSWEYLLKSKHHKTVAGHLSKALHLRKCAPPDPVQSNSKIQVNQGSVLFPYIRIVHFTLHLLYEDLKLNILRKNELKHLAAFLSKISYDLCLIEYQLHYWKDFPDVCKTNYGDRKILNEQELKNAHWWSCMSHKPVGIFQFLYEILVNHKVPPFPYIKNVNSRTKNVIQLFASYIKYSTKDPELKFENLMSGAAPSGTRRDAFAEPKLLSNVSKDNLFRVVEVMTHLGITNRELETYPISVNLVLYDAIWQCRENPPSDWPSECYTLLQRPDLTALALISNKKNSSESLPIFSQTEAETDDGMEDTDNALLKLRFPDDLRVFEVRRLLCSSRPVSVALTQRPDVSDHDFIEEQERHLYALCSRTMALPVGRGIFTLRMASPVITEPLTVPPLCLTGKAPPRGTTVELSHIDTPPSMNVWPLFHNGVANGLQITPEAKNIDSTWIVFNKPKGNCEIEHAGFLLALGLNGHLRNLETLNTFEYLSKVQEMITIGILLGLAVAHRGSCNMQVTRMLSIHLEALLPPTSMELDVPHNVQVAGLLGIGLLYQGTAHRHMTEVLLNEIGRPPGPEMENSVDRESYSLAAGLGLGLVVLGQGGKPCGLSDLSIADTLHYYMVGGNKRPLTGPQREKYKIPSFQIKEGTTVNLDVTASGATLALGLMYFGTGNKAVADWMSTPDTQFLLDAIRPDFLILRTLAKSLILWNDIEPSSDWIESHIPGSIKPFCMVEPSGVIDVDYEAVNQAYCNIVAGACFSLGLKYAGSADSEVFQILLRYCHLFTSLLGKSLAELAGKPTIECCLNLILLSAAMVMAGTGNLEIMRIVRHLRRRVGTAASAVVTYGSHLATHMALGLLFLGGGRYTLCNNPSSVAALIIAFYPKFPMHSNDNRYHLQAFRHLYVLAVEPRLIVPRDVMKGKMCYANLKIVKLNGQATQLRAPALIPELNTLYKVCVDDERYSPVVFERGRNWDKLELILSTYNCVDIKQRAGYVTFTEDHDGKRKECAETPTDVLPWLPSKDSIVSFTTDCTVWSFCNYFLGDAAKGSGEDEEYLKQHIVRTTYEAVVGDKLNVLPVVLSLMKVVENISAIDYVQLWQFKIISRAIIKRGLCESLISVENMLALQQNIVTYLERNESKLKQSIKSYLSGRIDDCKDDILSDLVTYLIYYDIPFHSIPTDTQNPIEKILKLKSLNIPTEVISKIIKFA